MLPNKTPLVAVIDFETFKIQKRPEYPPKPVGVAITIPFQDPVYYAWGHPTNNNCTMEEGMDAVQDAYRNWPILCHNAKFDLEVSEVSLGTKLIPSYGFHDTVFTSYLHNPHEVNYTLKYLSDKNLDLPPDEQTELFDWIATHVWTSLPKGEGDVVVSDSDMEGWHQIPKSLFGAFIAYAPGDLVGKYAIGDVVRTKMLFEQTYQSIIDQGMWEAYQLELDLLPEIIRMERQGLTVDVKYLRQEGDRISHELNLCETWLYNVLGNINLDSGPQLAKSMEERGLVTEWVYTAKGNKSTNKEALEECCNNKDLIKVLRHRNILIYNLRNFIRPWLTQVASTDNKVFATWNQTRNESGGARTNRISSSPNLMNIPNAAKAPDLPDDLIKIGVTTLPSLRKAIIPYADDEALISLDWKQQEIRILAHCANGQFAKDYNADPSLDAHTDGVSQIMAVTGVTISRTVMKKIWFGLTYGLGIASLAKALGVPVETARNFVGAFSTARPDIARYKKIVGRAKGIVTWMGRVHPVEKPRKVDGRLRSFEYKLLNAEIQGSAAEAFKKAVVEYVKEMRYGRPLLYLHDEIIISCKRDKVWDEANRLRGAMEGLDFRVPMLTDVAASFSSWGMMIDSDWSRFKVLSKIIEEYRE